MSASTSKAPSGPSPDPHAIEAMSWRVRLLTRVRGGQTLRRMRKLGLRAHPPIRLSTRVFIDRNYAWAVEIGAYTIIANDVRIIAHDAAIKRLTGYTEVRPVIIGERCYIGAGTIVLPGAVIGSDAIIGAGALVRGEIPPGSVAVGTPAKVIGSIEDIRERHLAQMESSPRIDYSPRDCSAAKLDALRRLLIEHGRIYVP
jgi:maltose O-acetyltransferase